MSTQPSVSPSTDQLNRDVCQLIHRFAQGLYSHARRVADELGLTAAQMIALRELDTPITPRELADRMTCEPSNVTFVVDRLEAQGLVQRRPHPTDRRAKQLVLTEAGAERRVVVLENLRAHSPLLPLSVDQRHQLLDLMRLLVPTG